MCGGIYIRHTPQRKSCNYRRFYHGKLFSHKIVPLNLQNTLEFHNK